MASVRDLLAVLATAALALVGDGLHPWFLATWLIALPICLIAPRRRAWPVLGLAFAGFLLGQPLMFHYATATVGLPAVVAVAFLAVEAAMFAVPLAVYAALRRRGHDATAVVAVTATAVVLDWAVTLSSPHGVLTSLAYTQADQPRLLGITAVTGGWGLTALLYAVPAALACLVPRASRRAGMLCLVAAVALGVAASATGAAVAAAGPHRELSVVLAVPRDDSQSDLGSPAGRRALADEVHAVASASRRNADVVVLPEAAVVADPTAAEGFTRRLTAAAGSHTRVVAGMALREGHRTFNESLLLGGGRAPVVYRKRHPIPGGEPSTPGTRAVSARVDGMRWSLAICKDMDFPGLVRAYGKQGATLFPVPAYDFGADDWLHSRMAVVSAASNGVPMLRPAFQGRLLVTDRAGRVVAEKHSSTRRIAVLATRVSVGGPRTPYAVLGDWLPWLSVLVLVLLLLAWPVRTIRIVRSDRSGTRAWRSPGRRPTLVSPHSP